MRNKVLDRFLIENEPQGKAPTAPALAHFFLSMQSHPDAGKTLQGKINEVILNEDPSRKDKAQSEQTQIEAITGSEQILLLMRRGVDPLNESVFIDKALEFEDELIPQILSKLKTSLNDGFVETAVRILTKSKKDVVAEIVGFYNDIKLPHAQAMVLVLLGFKADESIVPWMIEQYNKLKRLYPTQHHCEGAYYGLSEIENRFYLAEKGK